MYKHSPSRNQRAKGYKVKNIIQICVLLAVCFWLIYQVKHSRDKKITFKENDADTSLKINSHEEIRKLGGRRGLYPRLEERTFVNKKPEQEEAEEETGGEENDSKHEEAEPEEDNKTEEEENGGEEDESDEKLEGEEEIEEQNKNEEKEVNGTGGGDDEIDEHEQEKSELEIDEHEQEKSELEIEHEVDILDEERDRKEANETEDNETQIENVSHLEDHDHEAREEQYKGDDASSAVTHESEKENSENPIEKTEKNVLEDEMTTNITEEKNISENIMALEDRKGEMAENVNSLNVTGNGETGNEIDLSKQNKKMTSDLNSTASMEAKNQEMGNNLMKENPEANDTPKVNNTEAKQDGEGDFGSSRSLNNTLSDSNSINTQKLEAVNGESSNSSTASVSDVSGNAKTEENIDGNKYENSESENETGEIGTGEGDLGHHDPIDDSDSLVSLEQDVRTDLGTLPDIRIKGSNDEEAAAE